MGRGRGPGPHGSAPTVARVRPPGRGPGPAAARPRGAGRRLRRALAVGRDAGMATAEYAIATVAAAGFAGLLIAILRSDEVRGLLLGIVRGALAT
ncbi:DUF4244 domain-containing protein [Cellulomonas sp. APG4]|uniref:DUF4244 domain-containing protein n=1 Tax=Cellulomonas sp. APG4 TaxID=1538656 RepID=UPI00137A311E|nr:DUF4244 domain-containing protein [Cellulomonas sp. APG4]NCT92737.1 DUF4244 domain-containing protein [Cellulomonas sp. APG4]